MSSNSGAPGGQDKKNPLDENSSEEVSGGQERHGQEKRQATKGKSVAESKAKLPAAAACHVANNQVQDQKKSMGRHTSPAGVRHGPNRNSSSVGASSKANSARGQRSRTNSSSPGGHRSRGSEGQVLTGSPSRNGQKAASSQSGKGLGRPSTSRSRSGQRSSPGSGSAASRVRYACCSAERSAAPGSGQQHSASSALCTTRGKAVLELCKACRSSQKSGQDTGNKPPAAGTRPAGTSRAQLGQQVAVSSSKRGRAVSSTRVKQVGSAPSPPQLQKRSKKRELIQITVKTVMGQEIPVKVRADATVEDLKMKLYRLTDMDPDSQALVFNGEELDDDDDLLSEYRIQDGSTVQLLPRVSSGFVSY